MPPKDRMILPTAPRFALAWVIGDVRRSAIGLTMAGMVRLVSPALLAPRFRFGGAIQNRKAAPQDGANSINSHVGDIAQAEIANIATGSMLSLSIGECIGLQASSPASGLRMRQLHRGPREEPEE